MFVASQTHREGAHREYPLLSLLTVMAGAAVAPALNVIQAHFAQSSQTFVQMIISIPALFIVITNFFFPKLCRRLNPRTLVLLGLSSTPRGLRRRTL